MTFLPLLRRPYVLVLIILIILADIGGVVHAFRKHGNTDGTIALVLPPYGLYRAVESVMHQDALTDTDLELLSQTPEGRTSLIGRLRLKPEVWEALLGFISNDMNQEFRTSMHETGVPFDIIATVPAVGPVELTIQGRDTPDLTIIMVDANRDQEPESLRIIKRVDGKDEVHETPLVKFSTDDSSQFLFAWSLAWGTIAEELRGSTISVSQ